jgi:hypothetical protein
MSSIRNRGPLLWKKKFEDDQIIEIAQLIKECEKAHYAGSGIHEHNLAAPYL